MFTVIIIALVLAYLIAGLLYSLCYLWSYSPSRMTTELGLMIVFWPFYIILGIALQIAHSIGKTAKIVNHKLVEARVQGEEEQQQ